MCSPGPQRANCRHGSTRWRSARLAPPKAHERFFDLLRGQGYEIDRFLRAYERIAYDGFALATSTLALFWLAALLMLLVQELPRRGERETCETCETSAPRLPPVRRRFIVRRVFLRGAREYVRRDFHPSQNDNLHLARAYLAGIGVL